MGFPLPPISQVEKKKEVCLLLAQCGTKRKWFLPVSGVWGVLRCIVFVAFANLLFAGMKGFDIYLLLSESHSQFRGSKGGRLDVGCRTCP